MKIQESPTSAALQTIDQNTAKDFAGRTMSSIQIAAGQLPLSALLRPAVILNRVQELALQRLQQGEHMPLAERKIRVL